MSSSQEQPWSDDPNAPKVSYQVYFAEKVHLTGILIASILYGILTVLFFKCMIALLDPINRRGERVKWGLVSYTVVMFSLATVYTTTNLHILSISYVDNREFPGIEGELDPGPIGYLQFIYFKTITIVPNVTFVSSNWLADGLLLYRCYVVYSMNHWVIAFPCLMYLGSIATGTLFLFQNRGGALSNLCSGLVYFSISLSLNVTLTLATVVRLVLHGKNVRATTGTPAGLSGPYKIIATTLVESSALFTASSLLVIGPLAAKSTVTDLFFPILAETQVIASLLIIQRIASKRGLTSNAIVSGNISSFKPGGLGGFTGGSGTILGGYSMSSEGKRGTNSSCELAVMVETTIDFHRDRV